MNNNEMRVQLECFISDKALLLVFKVVLKTSLIIHEEKTKEITTVSVVL
jgi:hypothetical protein